MTKSRSSDSLGPAMSLVRCSVCGKFYDELTSVYLLELQGEDYTLKCIECDPEADYAPYSLTPKARVDSQ